MERPPLLGRALLRLATYALLWWILSNGDSASWIVGIPAIVLAAVVSFDLTSAQTWRWRLPGLIRFIPLFAWQSVRGGVDVAARALKPRMTLNPGIIYYPVRLPPGAAQIFFANTVSLLPGTLASDVRGGRITLQTLDTATPVLDDVAALEAMVAALFGADLKRE